MCEVYKRGGVLHVACVAESTVAWLGSTLVVAHLEVQFAFVGPQLSFSEISLVLIRHLGSQLWSLPFRVLLGDAAKGK